MAKKLPPHLHKIDHKKTGLHLHEILHSRGLSVRDVQLYLGLSCPQGIYRWLDGRALPNIDNLYALQGLLDMSVDQLICGSYKPRQMPQNLKASSPEDTKIKSEKMHPVSWPVSDSDHTKYPLEDMQAVNSEVLFSSFSGVQRPLRGIIFQKVLSVYAASLQLCEYRK